MSVQIILIAPITISTSILRYIPVAANMGGSNIGPVPIRIFMNE